MVHFMKRKSYENVGFFFEKASEKHEAKNREYKKQLVLRLQMKIACTLRHLKVW